MAKINPLQFGIMGAIVGGLNFALSENARRADEEALIAKEQRLAAIRDELAVRGEAREDARWHERNAIENEQAIDRDDRMLDRQLAVQHDAQNFQSGEHQADRQHDIELEDRRTRNNIAQTEATTGMQTEAEIKAAEHRERQRRAGVVFDTEYQRRRGPKSGNDPEAGKGILGDDGKTYPFGEPLPAGVKPVAGYGTSWAPSESKSQAPGARRRGVGREALQSAPQNAQGTQENPIMVRSKEEALQHRGKWVRTPSGAVNFVN